MMIAILVDKSQLGDQHFMTSASENVLFVRWNVRPVIVIVSSVLSSSFARSDQAHVASDQKSIHFDSSQSDLPAHSGTNTNQF